jgi:hypothetical protein
MSSSGLALVLAVALVSCGSPPPARTSAPPAQQPVVLLPAPSSVPAPPPPPPPASVVLVSVKSGAVADVAKADAVRILPLRAATESTESLHGVAHFPAAAAASVKVGLLLVLVHSLDPHISHTARIESVRPARDCGFDASFAEKRFAMARTLDLLRQPSVSWSAYVRLGNRDDRPIVRGDAVRQDGEETFVLRLVRATPARVERWRVTVGAPVEPRPGFPDREVEITAGLEPGDQVVLDGPLGLHDGDSVEAMTPPPRVTGNPKMESRGEPLWTTSPGDYPGTHWLLYPWGSGPNSAGEASRHLVRCVRDVGPVASLPQ